MNLILLEQSELDPEGLVHVSGVRAEHLVKVLKVGVGDRVRIGVIDRSSGVGIVTMAGDGCVGLRCELDGIVPPRPPVDLLLAVPRPKVLRRLWAQLAALGVGRIILTNAARVERNYFDTHVLTPECYRPLLIEGLQQARDTRLPGVAIHRQFKVLVEDHLDDLFPSGRRLLAHPGGGRALTTAVGGARDECLLLAVGPEGGWNEYELRLLEDHGFETFDMGPRTLRSDTAVIALVALAHAALRP